MKPTKLTNKINFVFPYLLIFISPILILYLIIKFSIEAVISSYEYWRYIPTANIVQDPWGEAFKRSCPQICLYLLLGLLVYIPVLAVSIKIIKKRHLTEHIKK